MLVLLKIDKHLVFLNRAKDSFFVPYVDLFDIPEVVQTLADGLKIHNETPDENKIKI